MFGAYVFGQPYFGEGPADTPTVSNVLAARFALLGLTAGHTIETSFEDRRIRSVAPTGMAIEVSFEDRRIRNVNPALTVLLSLQ